MGLFLFHQGSEIYERLPADSGSLGDDLEDRLRISCSDDDGHDSDMYILNQRNGSEHLVKPSQLKQQNKRSTSKGQRPPPPPGKAKLGSFSRNIFYSSCRVHF